MKIANCKKFFRSIFIILGLIFVVLLSLNKSALSYEEPKYKVMYVSSNDTLWNIAQRLQKGDFYKGKDVRYIIDNLIEINQLSSSTVYENQTLRIPII